MKGWIIIVKAPIGRYSAQTHTHLFGRLSKRSSSGVRDYRPGLMHDKPFFKLAKGVYFLTVNPEPNPNEYYFLFEAELEDSIRARMLTGKRYWEDMARSKNYTVNW